MSNIDGLRAKVQTMKPVTRVGRVIQVKAGTIHVGGLSEHASVGDRLKMKLANGAVLQGEVVQIAAEAIIMLPEQSAEGVSMGDRVVLLDRVTIAPSNAWLGRVIDPSGAPLDGKPMLRGSQDRDLRSTPPDATNRSALGERLNTGLAVFNTLLPIVQGQRLGLFAGSGVGKSSLMGHLAKHVNADVVVIALIGERGREVRDFIDNVLGVEGMKRAIVVAATSDQSPLVRRRCAWSAMAIAEHFRDAGKSVLLLADSITRFAEAHREIAIASGEAPVLRGHPASTSQMIMSLCERAGPGAEGQGDITALFTVLVAGSDMDEPIADILRGVLDGHVILDREIAERGRYPAIDLLRSVSRSLPQAATDVENTLINETRRALGLYDRNEVMIGAGLYANGSDPLLDEAIRLWPELDNFLAMQEAGQISDSFDKLSLILRRGRNTSATKQARQA